MFQIKVSTSANLPIRLLDSTGAPITGVVFGAVTATVFPNATGAGSSVSVTALNWLELAGGAYALTYTPTTVGPLVLEIVVAGAEDFIGVYDIVANLASDVQTTANTINTSVGAGLGAAVAIIGTNVASTLQVVSGNWTLDTVAKTLTFYEADGVTVLYQFHTFDAFGSPSTFPVYSRVSF